MKAVLVAILFCLSAHASFDQLSYRFLAPGDFFAKILQLFPNAHRPNWDAAYNFNGKDVPGVQPGLDCVTGLSYDDNSYLSLGAISPITGEAQAPSPNINTANVILKCGMAVIQSELQILESKPSLALGLDYDSSSDSELARDTIRRFYSTYGPIEASIYNRLLAPVVLSDAKTFEHTQFLVEYMLGPDEVISGYGKVNSSAQLANELLQEALKDPSIKTKTLNQYTLWVLSNLLLRDEFLTY